jgi:hypothetical protein
MCTVTYIPSKDGFYLTSNRDEHISRGHALAPRVYSNGKGKLLFPKDPDKSGSWIAAKDNGDVAVLLNGGFVKHASQRRYRKSRGLVLLDIINAEFPELYCQSLDLADIEPFTLVLFTSGRLYEFCWDGGKMWMTAMNSRLAHIWSSTTLYDKLAAAKRISWFEQWRKTNVQTSTRTIMDFHRYGGCSDPKDGLVIDRDGKMKTMSITNIRVRPAQLTMTYRDLRDDRRYTCELPVTKPKRECKPKKRFLGLKRTFIRLFNWEYWSFFAVYSPILFYWFWLCLRSRSFFFFSSANPLIENGGFACESKKRIYDQIPQQFYPRTLLFRAGATLGDVQKVMRDTPIDFPVIAKPDVGARGIQVKLIHDEAELASYVQQIRVDFLVQDYIPFDNEVGLFYYRFPGENEGRLSGIVGKEFLSVFGDGYSTIEELLISEPRYLLQLPELRRTDGNMLKRVLKARERFALPYGNHARGAKFIDLSGYITPQLEKAIDAVCKQIPEFYFGRLDVKYNTWRELCRGENISIIELNGAGSEPTHIYDPSHSIFFAWKEIIRHWKLLQQIARTNKLSKGLSYMTFKEGMAMLKQNSAYNKSVG